MEALFGPELITSKGRMPTADALKGKKSVAIYFSAHWCPPCRGFTPTLATFYELCQENDADALEIVFASSDQDEAAFNEYFGEMPWIALPFGSRQKEALSEKFAVRGIPTLVVVDANGNTKDMNGRETVMNAKGDTAKACSKWV